MLPNLVIIFVTFAFIKSAKILVVVPTPSISHQVVFRSLIHELIKLNHEVTVITSDPVYTQGKSPNNLTEIVLHDVSYLLWNKMLKTFEEERQSNMVPIMTAVYSVATKIFHEHLKDKSVQKLITDKKVKFDLLIIEACIIPDIIFGHVFKAPIIRMSSFGANPGMLEIVGAVTHPLLYPTHFHQRIYNLTIWEKITELYSHVNLDQMITKQQHLDNKMLQSVFGIDTPPLKELENNIHVMFLNLHQIWVHNQPVPQNVVYTWGIVKAPKQILSKDLQSYLDSAENGVFYVSFGTNVKSSSIDSEKLDIYLKVFTQLPCNILWKWDMDELPIKSDKIKISKWFPQYEVLRHPNVKLFITQGGMQSTDEAIDAGVPLIGIPMFLDQEYNTEKYVQFKIGIQLNFKTLTVEMLSNAIETILKDESYRKNIHHLRTQMHDQPKPALENAVWWIEYVLRHGGARHLRAPAANMSWTEYYELELILLLLGGLTTLLTILTLTIYSCFRYICTSRIITININHLSKIPK